MDQIAIPAAEFSWIYNSSKRALFNAIPALEFLQTSEIPQQSSVAHNKRNVAFSDTILATEFT